jgi:hypothetical protein
MDRPPAERERHDQAGGAMSDVQRAACLVFACASAMGTGSVGAAEQPPGCNGNFVAAGISPLAEGQPIAPGLGVVPGQTINYRVTLWIPEASPPFIFCDVAQGQLSVTLPSWLTIPAGQFVPVAGYPGTPEVAPFGGGVPQVYVVDVPYVVDPAGAVNGHLHARVDYGMTDYLLFAGQTQENGIFLSEPPQQSASASASHTLPLRYPAVSAAASAEPTSICGGTPTQITFTVTVANPGEADLAGVVVIHDSCGPMSDPQGDDGDGLLNPAESWTYTCTAFLDQPAAPAVAVTAQAVDFYGNPVPGPVYEAAASASISAGQGAACDISGGLGAACAGQFCGPADMAGYAWSVSGGAVIQGASDQACVLVQGDADGSFSISLQVTDAIGCTGSCTVAMADTMAPQIKIPPDLALPCGAPFDPQATGWPAAADDCDPAPAMTWQDSTMPGSCAGAALVVRTWTVTDLAGNSASGVQHISLVDTAPPQLVIPADTVVGCQAPTGPAYTGSASATDACGGPVTLGYVDQPGNQSACADVILRTWTATDACGNSVSLTQSITVADLAGPQLFLPPNQLITCDKDIDLTKLEPATATDPCSGLVSISYVEQWASRLDPDETFAPGQIPVECWQELFIIRTWTAVDACGNTQSGNQIIAFVDETPPYLDAPGNVTVSCEQPLDPNHTGNAFAFDFCDPFPFKVYADQVTPGPCPNQFTIARTWTAVDHCGNTSPPQVQIISVRDDIDPQLLPPPPQSFYSDAGLCGAILAQDELAQPDIYDNCSADPDLIVLAARGDGQPFSAPFPLGSTTVLWRVQDQCGNLSSPAAQTVTVLPHSPIEISVQIVPAPVAGPLVRCIRFLAAESGSGRSIELEQDVTFVAGLAKSVQVLVPCALEGSPVLYDCLSARDALHTLESSGPVFVSGSAYASDLSGPAGLRLGDLNADGVVSAADVTVYQQEQGSNYGGGATPCASPFDPLTNPHADLNGDGLVNAADGSILAAAMNQSDDPPCAGPALALVPPQPPQEADVLDSNGDGVVDLLDALDFLAGHPAISVSDGGRSWFDPRTWADGLPDATRAAYISSLVVIDRPGARARMVVVGAGGTLRIARGALEAGALVVHNGGRLEVSEEARMPEGLVIVDGATVLVDGTAPQRH